MARRPPGQPPALLPRRVDTDLYVAPDSSRTHCCGPHGQAQLGIDVGAPARVIAECSPKSSVCSQVVMKAVCREISTQSLLLREISRHGILPTIKTSSD